MEGRDEPIKDVELFVSLLVLYGRLRKDHRAFPLIRASLHRTWDELNDKQRKFAEECFLPPAYTPPNPFFGPGEP